MLINGSFISLAAEKAKGSLREEEDEDAKGSELPKGSEEAKGSLEDGGQESNAFAYAAGFIGLDFIVVADAATAEGGGKKALGLESDWPKPPL